MINTNPGGATSAVAIQIRGLASLSAQAQPLLVVDGIVVRNGDANNEGYWGGNQRINGNGLLDINPENIESVNILKGAAASALYGSDANFGVIVITTKNGKGFKKGLGIDVNLSGSIEKAYIPKGYQTEYGPGYDRSTNINSFGSDDEGWIHLTVDGQQVVRPIFRSYAQFGPKIDGRQVYWWDGEMRPYTSSGPIWKDFYKTGYSSTANLALNNSSDKYNYRFSYTRNDYTGIQRGGNQQKNSFNLNTTYNITSKITLDLISNFINENVHNRPKQVYYLTNNYGGFVSPVDRMDVYLNKYQTSKGYKWVRYDSNLDVEERLKYHIRGYDFLDFLWDQLANSRDESTNRFINSITVNYKILNGLTFRGRYGNDITSYFSEQKDRSTQPISFGASGSYGTINNRYLFNYGDLLLTYQKGILPKLNITPSIGYQARVEDYRYNSASTSGGLTSENWFSLSASKDQAVGSTTRAKLVKDGIFGIVNIDYNNYLFIEGTIRQERSSTLYPDYNTYYYGGISGAFEISNALSLPSFISYSKLRAAWGSVGNPPQMYKGNVLYNASSVQGIPILTTPSEYGNEQLRNERRTNIEIGFENRFFKNRLGFDITWYRDHFIDQFSTLKIPSSSGASSILVNVGTMEGSGIELGLYGTPITTHTFNWDTRLNLSFNSNKVKSLLPGLNELELANVDNGSIIVKTEVGEKAGNIYLYKRKTDASGNYIINSDGFYEVNYDEQQLAGNIQPKVVGGYINTFSYKNLSLNVVMDFRFGGQSISPGILYATGAGMYDNSLLGRDAEHGGLPYYIDNAGKYVGVTNGTGTGPNGEKIYHDGIILQGVTNNGSVNSTIIDAANYYLTTYQWGSWPGYASGSLYEGAVFDNDYIKVREASLSYTLPLRFASKLKMQSLTVSIFGRNLFYVHKTLPYVDAEDGVGTSWISRATTAGSGNAATRSIGASIRLTF